MSAELENVADLRIPISETDGAELQHLSTRIVRVQALIGAARSAYLREEAELMQELSAVQEDYARILQLMSRRYLPKGPGQYSYRPEIGAFVAEKER